MTRVRLGDVAREVRKRTIEGSDLPTVGLEHLDPGEVELTRWDEDVETTFTKGFEKGQVLFGRRRAYLHKAVVAPFDGVCSGDITVIAAGDGLSPRLLPFIIQNDALFKHAVEKSAGSLSPRVKWQGLAEFEIELPGIQAQEGLADVLWAAQETRRRYKRLLATCDDVVKSQFVEIFSEKEFPLIPLSQACTKITDGTHKTPQYQEAGIAFISAKNVTSDGKLDFSDIKHISTDEYESIQKRCETQIGDVLLTKSGSLGMPAIVDVDFPIGLFESLAVLKYRRDILDGVFLREQLKSARVQDQFTGGVKGIAVKHLHLNVIGRTSIIVPPLELQEEFTDFVLQVDKSKFAVQQALDELNATTKKILNQELGLGDV